jgi:hypothetical protein
MIILFAAPKKFLLVLESLSYGDDDNRWKVNEDLKRLNPTAIRSYGSVLRISFLR